jgi:type IV fimbrial biogenesis protein FimT
MSPKPATPAFHRQRGVSIVESSVVLGLTSLLVGLASPSFVALKAQQQLKSVAAQLETDLVHARSQAVAMNRTLRLQVVGPRCYVVHDGPPATCTCQDDGSAQCSGGVQVLQTQQWPSNSAVTLQSNSSAIAFDAIKGTVTPTATFKLSTPSGERVHNVINIMGRVRSCSPAPGQTSC